MLNMFQQSDTDCFPEDTSVMPSFLLWEILYATLKITSWLGLFLFQISHVLKTRLINALTFVQQEQIDNKSSDNANEVKNETKSEMQEVQEVETRKMKIIERFEESVLPSGSICLLDCSRLDLTEWPELHNFGAYSDQLPYINCLNFSDNYITCVPHDIARFVSLTELVLRYNQITELSENIGSLSDLVDLQLQWNYLERLPSSICLLRNLSILNLSNNQLVFLPEDIGQLVNLETLNIYRNNLKSLPASLSNCTALKEIYASDNELECFPYIGHMKDLAELDLSSNKLIEFPKGLEHTRNLVYLDVSYNMIENVPVELSRCTKLRELSIRQNLISYLPGELLTLEHINHFNSNYNKFFNSSNEKKSLKKVLDLKEMCGRFILHNGVKHCSPDLPLTLRNYLESCQPCTICGKVFLDNYYEYYEMRSFGGSQILLPFRFRLCSLDHFNS